MSLEWVALIQVLKKKRGLLPFADVRRTRKGGPHEVCESVSGVLGVAALFLSANALAKTSKYDPGKREYMSNCSSCHGEAGKEDGPFIETLKHLPPDLTTLAKRNGGIFLINHVYMVIDGREVIKWHGPRDMPVLGADYIVSASKEVAAPSNSTVASFGGV